MVNQLSKKIHAHQYSLLLASCLLIIVTSPFFRESRITFLLNAITLAISIVAGLIVIGNRRNLRTKIIRTIGYTTLAMQLISLLSVLPGDLMSKLIPVIYIVYFTSISLVVYNDIYRARQINGEMVAAVFCGFIMLGLLASFIFTLVEIFEPNSFSGLEERLKVFDNLVYFSFISLLTIGYGDMAPQTDVAKVVTICIALAGHFYTVFVTGIVIGKFLSGRNLS